MDWVKNTLNAIVFLCKLGIIVIAIVLEINFIHLGKSFFVIGEYTAGIMSLCTAFIVFIAVFVMFIYYKLSEIKLILGNNGTKEDIKNAKTNRKQDS